MELNTIETERIKAVNRYDILDTPKDGNFDRITVLASKMFNVPIAIISIVDEDRIWFKSQYGLEGVKQIDREPGLCASAILSKDVYLVENAIEDPRCMTNPLVCSDFGLRFYAAAPLQTKDGHNLGTLCIIDKKQRFIHKGQLDILEEMAAIVVDELELRLAARIAIKKSSERIAELENQLKNR
ncbi:GAF domain-containing protein [Antarcticibacterium arcticum]|uniref:GAF domain-containing protein n=1 Tax=Antarcticibacterium arcticum TaxID=2585771 RepID=A0A5B8YLS6_9FLAO|nr:GAF domain-containing protein [Antarcticibacterium arcticum]QED36679.1 GAF domain-containing protein [Antarcticibacterium arcticum]